MSWSRGRVPTTVALMTVILATLAIAGPDKSRSPVTARSLTHDVAATAAAAGAPWSADQLQRIDLGPRPDAPITEAGAVVLLKSLGIGASTSNPGRIVTPERADALMILVRGALPSLNRPRGGSGTVHELPAQVDGCFQERNHGACMDCCKSLGGSGSACAKACMVINKPSPEEPIP